MKSNYSSRGCSCSRSPNSGPCRCFECNVLAAVIREQEPAGLRFEVVLLQKRNSLVIFLPRVFLLKPEIHLVGVIESLLQSRNVEQECIDDTLRGLIMAASIAKGGTKFPDSTTPSPNKGGKSGVVLLFPDTKDKEQQRALSILGYCALFEFEEFHSLTKSGMSDFSDLASVVDPNDTEVARGMLHVTHVVEQHCESLTLAAKVSGFLHHRKGPISPSKN